MRHNDRRLTKPCHSLHHQVPTKMNLPLLCACSAYGDGHRPGSRHERRCMMGRPRGRVVAAAEIGARTSKDDHSRW
jgi:hypothetical protein